MSREPIRDPILERPLPSSPDTERAILGAIILDNRLIDEATSLLQPNDFYVPSHRRIFIAMMALFERGAEINPILVAEELRRDNSLESTGGVLFLTNLTNGLPHVSSVKTFCKILKSKSTARWGVKEAARIQAAFIDEEDDPQAILASATERFSSMREKGVQGISGGRLIDLAPQVEDHLYLLQAGVNPAIATGLESLDRLTGGGPVQGEMWGTAARSSEGKSSKLVQELKHAARHGVCSILFSLEMKALLIALRCLAAEAGVPMHKIRYGLTDTEIQDLLKRVKTALDYPIWLYTDCKSVHDIRNRIRVVKRQAADEGKVIKKVGIDYYGKLSGYGGGRDRYENRTQELKYIADFLQQEIAIAEDVALDVPAQFNRSAWGLKEPGPANIDGGEAYYQSCDLFATLITDPQKGEDAISNARLSVFKQRNGPTAMGKRALDLTFHRQKMEFNVALKDLGEEVPDDKEDQFL